jgi:TolB-like protein
MTVSILLSVILFAPDNQFANAGNEAIENQVANILYEESAQRKIKVVILDFSVSTAPGEGKLSEKESRDRGTRFTEEFTAGIMDIIKNSGKREKIAIIDRSKLDDVLRERKSSAPAGTEPTAIDIGRMIGVDVIITGGLKVAGNSVTATAKVIRVKDGEILDIVKQDKQDKPSPTARTQITILDTVENLKIGSYKALPLRLSSGGSLNVTVDVLRGNPVDVTVIPGSELENFKEQKKFNKVGYFTATKKKSFNRSADLESGDYYLVVRDSSLGLFSSQSSDIKILVKLEP